MISGRSSGCLQHHPPRDWLEISLQIKRGHTSTGRCKIALFVCLLVPFVCVKTRHLRGFLRPKFGLWTPSTHQARTQRSGALGQNTRRHVVYSNPLSANMFLSRESVTHADAGKFPGTSLLDVFDLAHTHPHTFVRIGLICLFVAFICLLVLIVCIQMKHTYIHNPYANVD